VKITKNEPTSVRLICMLANEEFLTLEIPRYALERFMVQRNEPLKKHHSFLVGVRASSGLSPGPQPVSCSISASCSHLARRLSGPALECMRECTDLVKAEQPRDLGYMQLAVIEVTNR